VAALGPTWDIPGNPLISHMLPERHLYNGFGFGQFWPNQMRLDRVLVRGPALDCEQSHSRLFANRPIHPDPQERTESWQEYLFPSDHFGILVDIPLVDAAVIESESELAPPPTALPLPGECLGRVGIGIGVAALVALLAVSGGLLPSLWPEY